MKKFWLGSFILISLTFIFVLAVPSQAQYNVNYCTDGEAPPDCVQGHTVTLNCEVNPVFEGGTFVGWDALASASTSPSATSNLSGFGTYGISENATYQDSYAYKKFIPASTADPKPTMDFVAGVTEAFHVGSAECHLPDTTPYGGEPIPSGSITASPNPCSIPSGALQCTSYITWGTTEVSSARVVVSFNGGPEGAFKNQTSCSGQSCPAGFITPSPDYYDFRLYDYSSGFKGQLLDSVRVTAERSSPQDTLPTGNFDNAECTQTGGSISGWAFDADSPNASVKIQIYRDGPKGQGGVYVGEYLADQPRPDVNQALGISGDHGFSIYPLPDTFRDGALHYVYIYAVNTNASAPNALLSGSPRPLQCPVTPVCPTTSTFRVTLASNLIRVGGKTLAIAPSGWTGGRFVSSSSSASVGDKVGENAEINGISVGTANIFGTGWVAGNGATGCDLGQALLSVEPAVSGFISADPNIIKLCQGDMTGSTKVTAGANAYAEVRVYGAEGIPEGQVFFTLLAFETKTVQTGDWVKQGTVFKLVAPLEGEVELASLTMNVQQVVCDTNPPKVDLKAVNPDGSLTDGPVQVSVGGGVPLEWVSENTDRCVAIGGWSQDTGSTGKGHSGAVFSSQTFVVECEGGGSKASDSVTVNVVLPPLGPAVDLKYLNSDGSVSDGPVTVPANSAITLKWTSQNTQSCTATGGWTTSQAVSGQQTGIVVPASRIYEIICLGLDGGQARDTLQVQVSSCPLGQTCGGQGGPVTSNVYNTSSAVTAGLAVACGQILATWPQPAGAVDGFRMYYLGEDGTTWERLWDIPYGTAQSQGSGAGLRFYFRFTPPGGELTKLFRYRVYTYLGTTEFPPLSDSTGSPIASEWPCNADFNGSNKDIIRIRNKALPYDIRQNQDSEIASATPIIERDLITFSINVLNSGEVPFTGDIVVDDDMENLQKPQNGWGVKVDCANECSFTSAEYNPVTRRMTFVLKPRPNQDLAPGGVEIWTIEFTAMAFAENSVNKAFRFQNTAYINGNTTPLLKTPRILVLPAGSPEIKEIQ